MLLIGLENSRSPHQCFFSAFTSDAPPYDTLLPRELAERQFLLKSSRAPARVGALKQPPRVRLRACFPHQAMDRAVEIFCPKLQQNWPG
jgi:hypothetical protein